MKERGGGALQNCIREFIMGCKLCEREFYRCVWYCKRVLLNGVGGMVYIVKKEEGELREGDEVRKRSPCEGKWSGK